MNGVLSASRLMTAAEVRMECQKLLNNPTLLLAVELEAKKKLFGKASKVAS
ncbi:hypothetical protein [Pseudobacillus badius]|uniref:hypothetical protein n=1 Tax=Bacillus badius TaxID=1455 RepID=UPI000A5FADA9|nr:hypothetical protein [Bacillus badius]